MRKPSDSPAGRPPTDQRPSSPAGAIRASGSTLAWLTRRAVLGTVVAIALGTLAAEPITPSPITVLEDTGQSAPGYIFYTQQHQGGPAGSTGPVIVDNQGRPVWFLPLASGVAADLRVQTYQGQPVLTWAQGDSFQNPTPGTGVDYICDSSYHVIATVRAGNGMNADLHEFKLTPQGTALITIYHQVSMDLSPWGGPVNGSVLEGVAQEIDVATGKVVWEWHSLDHVGLDESNFSVPTTGPGPFDYFHINSVNLDTDGNFIISARHTSTIYKVNRATGEIMWRLGGKKNNFTLGPGLSFGWQHDVVPVDASTLRIFDNESGGRPSRVLWIHHDDATMTATLLRSYQHPAGYAAIVEGSAQDLSNGDTFIGWGIAGAFSEIDANNNLVYDARQQPGYSLYRAYRFPWVGHPTTTPAVEAYQNDDGTLTVHAIWNGATEVAKWNILGSTGGAALSQITAADWNGLDTAVTVTGPLDAVQVVAVDATGATLGSSTTLDGPFLPEPPTLQSQPVAQTVATNGSVVFRIEASAGAHCQWSRNGTALSDGTVGVTTTTGATTPTLMLRGVTPADAGDYTCTVSNAAAAVTSDSAALKVIDTATPGRLVNLSCRSDVKSGDQALVVGFVLGGNAGAGSEPMLVRASGPALTTFGVSDALPDPKLMLFTSASSTTPIASDDGWNGDAAVATAADAVKAFPWTDPQSHDSALVQSLAAGAYTATVTSSNGASGVSLAEAYDDGDSASNPAAPHLINGSGRALVGTGTDVLVAGFVIGGSTAETVLIRAAGPALAKYGVSQPLADPQLQIYSSDGKLVAANTGWAGDAAISAVANAIGAFPFTDPASGDSAILLTLPPGGYTAQVSGASGDTGVALVEVYEVH